MDGLDILNENVGSEAEDDLPVTQPVDDRVLKGVVAYVEVRTTNDNRSEAVGRELAKLGAVVVKKFTPDVTHVVFKEGSNRTKTKAQKKGIHLVSVLWVENCKLNQEHVSERMYPAVVPKLKGTPLLMTKLRKAKSMQPRDFEEELASSAERVRRKRKKNDAINRLKSLESTPASSPRAVVLVQDTQPRSPDDGFVLTPIRLTIPETPPSMREKMKKLKLAKEGATGSYTAGEMDDDDTEDKHMYLKQLQKKLFNSEALSGNDSNTTQSPITSSVFMSDSETLQHNVSADSESSVNNEIFKIAQNINASLNTQIDKNGTGLRMFGVDSDENLLSSQEIKTVVNIPVKLKQPTEKILQNTDEESIKLENIDKLQNAKTSQKQERPTQNEESLLDRKQRRRSSRRLSVQQAVQELDTSTILNFLPEESEDKSPTADLPNSKENSIAAESEKMKSENERSESKMTDCKEKTVKKTMKKKLMSLTDLNEQHSVLIEPTKCSVDERPQLEPTKCKGKRGRKKKTATSDNSTCSFGADALDSDKNGKITKTKTSRKMKPHEESEKDATCADGGKKRNSDVKEIGQRKTKKGKKALVNETCIDDDSAPKVDKENVGQSPVTTLQDVTTQLNLTKDNGLVCSIRETTLSLSMSTAYTDANMPSFLISQRRSIDEFNASQRQNKKQKLRDGSVLTSINEQENSGNQSSSDSDPGVTGGKRKGKVSVSQHRKIVRPSLVMTSLHSHEQDVVISVVKKLGGFVIAENVNETTTHIICGESRRTLNVLYGLAQGVWLLSKEWVLKSLEMGKWIPESEFECTDSFPACKVARLEHEKCPGLYRQSLFTGIGRVYISGRSKPPRQHLVQLLKLCGGQVIGVREKASLYLGSDYHPGMTCVKTNWLLDCITSHKLLPMDRYYLDRPKRESSPVY